MTEKFKGELIGFRINPGREKFYRDYSNSFHGHHWSQDLINEIDRLREAETIHAKTITQLLNLLVETRAQRDQAIKGLEATQEQKEQAIKGLNHVATLLMNSKDNTPECEAYIFAEKLQNILL